MLSTRDPLQTQGHIQTESQGMEKDISCKWKQQESGEAILISDKTDFKTKAIKKDKEEYYRKRKGSIQEEDITLTDIYAPNIEPLNL